MTDFLALACYTDGGAKVPAILIHRDVKHDVKHHVVDPGFALYVCEIHGINTLLVSLHLPDRGNIERTHTSIHDVIARLDDALSSSWVAAPWSLGLLGGDFNMHSGHSARGWIPYDLNLSRPSC